jgi:hypothetical protein
MSANDNDNIDKLSDALQKLHVFNFLLNIEYYV